MLTSQQQEQGPLFGRGLHNTLGKDHTHGHDGNDGHDGGHDGHDDDEPVTEVNEIQIWEGTFDVPFSTFDSRVRLNE